ncbi:MAG: hypothetical protein QOJ11_423 [Frankiales bacterium]|nr:hypothetical protein [Frankiales bacterium]
MTEVESHCDDRNASIGLLRVADHEVADPLDRLMRYATDNATAVTRFDLVGPGDPLSLTIEEVRRTRKVNSRITMAETGWFVELGRSAPWAAVPADASLPDADPGTVGALYDAALALYEHFSRHESKPKGVAVAKVSKVLHVKRPALIPILDSRLERRYRVAAAAAGRRYTDQRANHKRLYWAAIRDDLVDPANAEVLRLCRRRLLRDDNPCVRHVGELTDLRLLDIITWQSA